MSTGLVDRFNFCGYAYTMPAKHKPMTTPPNSKPRAKKKAAKSAKRPALLGQRRERSASPPAPLHSNLNPAVKAWNQAHYGALSQVARDAGVSVSFVHRIAYNLNGNKSKDFKIERTLRSMGCPLSQTIPE